MWPTSAARAGAVGSARTTRSSTTRARRAAKPETAMRATSREDQSRSRKPRLAKASRHWTRDPLGRRYDHRTGDRITGEKREGQRKQTAQKYKKEAGSLPVQRLSGRPREARFADGKCTPSQNPAEILLARRTGCRFRVRPGKRSLSGCPKKKKERAGNQRGARSVALLGRPVGGAAWGRRNRSKSKVVSQASRGTPFFCSGAPLAQGSLVNVAPHQRWKKKSQQAVRAKKEKGAQKGRDVSTLLWHHRWRDQKRSIWYSGSEMGILPLRAMRERFVIDGVLGEYDTSI